jgi:hypothetical protein
MKRVQQRTTDDCMIAGLAMMLDKEYDEVMGWYTSNGRKWNTLEGLLFTLLEKGYDISFADESGIGRWGGIRRLVASVDTKKSDNDGHVFVIDETESVCDPSPGTPNPFDMSKLFGRLAALGHRVECVVQIEKV